MIIKYFNKFNGFNFSLIYYLFVCLLHPKDAFLLPHLKRLITLPFPENIFLIIV